MRIIIPLVLFILIIIGTSIKYRDPEVKIEIIEKKIPVPVPIPSPPDTIIIYKDVKDLQIKRQGAPKEQHLKNMIKAANAIYVPLLGFMKEKLGYDVDIPITSFYRNSWYNRRCKGATRSQHLHGLAFDFDLMGKYKKYGLTNYDLYRFIKESLEFDQLIIYTSSKAPTYIHVSFNEGKNRKKIYLAYYNNKGQLKYKNITNYK